MVFLSQSSFFEPLFVNRSHTLKKVFVIVSRVFVNEAAMISLKYYKECPFSPYCVTPLNGKISEFGKEEEATRQALLQSSVAMMSVCEEVVVYVDKKSTWTEDMKFYLEEAKKHGKKIVFRDLCTRPSL
jgi:hypothetical protein